MSLDTEGHVNVEKQVDPDENVENDLNTEQNPGEEEEHVDAEPALKEENDLDREGGSELDAEQTSDAKDNLDEEKSNNNGARSLKSRRVASMDAEHHDHPTKQDVPANSYETAPLTEYGEGDEDSSNSAPQDDDSFCEAEDDCEPNEKFLQEMLNEHHPDRLNLLDDVPRPDSVKSESKEDSDEAPEKETEEKPSETPSETPSEKPSETKEEDAVEKSETPAADKSASVDKVEVEKKEVDHEKDENHDSFEVAPVESRPRPPGRTMESMGNSTKKSFRKMSTTFWAKPFKSLTSSMRRSRPKNSLDSLDS